jgi:hypothetical protein
MTMNTQERYAVYHANDPLAVVAPQAARWYADRSRHYTHVADVVAPLEQVFTLTNHIDRPWTSNPQVIWYTTASPVRSTSVGDVIVSQESGRAWLVMPVGLQELAPESELGTGEGRRADPPQAPTDGKEGRS